MSIGGQPRLTDLNSGDTATADRDPTGVRYFTWDAAAQLAKTDPLSFQLLGPVGAARWEPGVAPGSRLGPGGSSSFFVVDVTAPWHMAPGAIFTQAVDEWTYAGDTVSIVAEAQESDPRESLAAYVEGFFRLSPDARMWCTLAQVECARRTYPFPRGLTISVYRDEDQYVCEHRGLRLYGMGARYAEAFAEFCEFFDVLFQEYVDTSDRLDSGAQRLAQRLRDLVRA